MLPSDAMEEIRITAPGPGRCPICAAMHGKAQPHDRYSLYYMMRFYRKHNRFPTEADAAQHCRRGAPEDARGGRP